MSVDRDRHAQVDDLDLEPGSTGQDIVTVAKRLLESDSAVSITIAQPHKDEAFGNGSFVVLDNGDTRFVVEAYIPGAGVQSFGRVRWLDKVTHSVGLVRFEQGKVTEAKGFTYDVEEVWPKECINWEQTGGLNYSVTPGSNPLSPEDFAKFTTRLAAATINLPVTAKGLDYLVRNRAAKEITRPNLSTIFTPARRRRQPHAA